MPATPTSICLDAPEGPVAEGPGAAARRARADAGLNLAVYGFAAMVTGVSAVAACVVLFGWAAWRKRSAARRAGAATLNLGGPLLRMSLWACLVLTAAGAAVLSAPEMPSYSSPITVEVLPPPVG